MALHILGIGSHPEQMASFRRSAEMFGVDVNYMMRPPADGIGERAYEWMRIMSYVDYAKSVPEDDIILCTDTYDVIINQSTETIIDRFRAKGCDILLSGEMNCHPSEHLHKWNGIQSPTKHQYPNGGCYMGTARGLLYMFGGWKSLAETESMCKGNCDQGYLHDFYIAHHGQRSRVQVDWDCSVFQSMHLISWNDFVIREGHISNEVMRQEPCVVHFNGGVWKTMSGMDIQPVFLDKMDRSRDDHVVRTLAEYSQRTTATCYPHSQI